MDGPASRGEFVFGIVSLGASRWPPQIVIRYVAAAAGMAFFVAPNLFYLFFRDPTSRVTPQQLKDLFADRGIIATGEKERLALRWGNGPVLYASIVRDGTAEVLAIRLAGSNRKYRDLISGYDTYIEISFESLDEVLDEINTLIEVQSTLQDATGGLIYRSWNLSFSGPDE